MSRIFNVISPHLDDASLSCSLFMAANPGSCLTTIFADGPESARALTPSDRTSRYVTDGADARASAVIQATACRMPYWDHQYRNDRYGYAGLPDSDLPEAIAADLLRQGQDLAADGWVIPLGLGHPDHRLAGDAALIVAERRLQFLPVYVYEELPFAVEVPAEVAMRKWRLAERGLTLEEDHTLAWLDDSALNKAVFGGQAPKRHQNNWRARTATCTPERVWRLVRAA
jgi:hypothetical protein